MPDCIRVTRREALLVGAAFVVLERPARATPASMAAAMHEFTGGAEARPGRIRLDVPALVDNGNSVAVTVAVDSPMLASDHVRRIAIFNEKNPQPGVVTFSLGPRSGRASIATRMRLADSQRVTAIAELSDGTYWSASADVIVTLAACLEG